MKKDNTTIAINEIIDFLRKYDFSYLELLEVLSKVQLKLRNNCYLKK